MSVLGVGVAAAWLGQLPCGHIVTLGHLCTWFYFFSLPCVFINRCGFAFALAFLTDIFHVRPRREDEGVSLP